MSEQTIGRWILTLDGIRKGYLRVSGDTLLEVCWGEAPTGSKSVLVLPSFVNAHTHIGDSLAFPAPPGSVKEIVGPPDGYKHKILRSKSSREKVDAMRIAIQEMRSTGTSLFCDFREEGVEGLRSFREAVDPGSPRALVLGRPGGLEPSRDEVRQLLDSSDGLGFSAVSDWPIDLLKSMSREARSAGKKFALHASEVVREDLDTILELEPDFLVHMCKATPGDLETCREADVPIVVCPSSNRFFGLDTNLPRLLKAGLTVGLGTDNGMIARPSILSELKTAFSISSKGGVRPLEIVRLATFCARKVLNADAKITTEVTENDDLLAVRTTDMDPLGDLVTRTRSDDILATIHGGRLRRTGSWMT